ncbi:hypothetical protein [Streptomyces sp. NPDC058953]|uniref:hypothetical protein n=1 Tax=Streptomyces sp. NPDC058953 TaxID=3346676 RepID=UPI003686EC62
MLRQVSVVQRHRARCPAVFGPRRPGPEERDRHDAVARAEPGDTVLVAGKGHEQGQDIAGVVRPFDDRSVLADAIRATTPENSRG